jgi:pimeloyl-ACP methyl ester carboxylesterase
MSRSGRGVARAALFGVLLMATAVLPAQAQAPATCQTPNGPRTLPQIQAELRVAGYDGPWDPAAEVAAYARATGGPVTCDQATTTQHAPIVVLVAGYGSNLASAGLQFAPLTAALYARDPTVRIVPFSYNGSSVHGCDAEPAPYTASDTAQPLEVSNQKLRETLTALEGACPAERIGVVGHSLGGLIGLQSLGDHPIPGVTNIVTVDSPLGGVPQPVLSACVETGLCSGGPVVADLARLNTNWSVTEQDNATRAAALDRDGARLSAWGNQSDCFYKLSLCSSLSVAALPQYDVVETQWLGIPHAVRENVTYPPRIWNIQASHLAVLMDSSAELAAEVLP